MAFDDDLTRAFDALSDRLHAEVQRQIEAAMAELRAAVPPPAPVVPLPSAVDPPTPAPLTHARPEPVEGPPSLEPGVLDAIRAMDAARSLTDILDALATGALNQSDAISIAIHRSGQSEAWRTVGDLAGADTMARPLTIAGETIGELRAAGGSADALEILARHASRCLESMTAFKTARALAKQADGPTDEQIGEEDASARRYAKLLVSEIKLYHEGAVLAGRRDRDLGARLGGEISRARVLYDQRVPPHVRQRADYFHDELVRTLADGDPTLLEFQA